MRHPFIQPLVIQTGSMRAAQGKDKDKRVKKGLKPTLNIQLRGYLMVENFQYAREVR